MKATPEPGLYEYFTAGKEYDVLETHRFKNNMVLFIRNDDGEIRICIEKNDAHLNFKNWILW